MERFDRFLEKEIMGYEGDHSQLIRQAPALYRLMSRLMGDRALPRNLWQLVIAAIAYFILPQDLIPEESYGPKGFVDDIFLCALVADRVLQATGSEDILVRNWDGDVPIVALIKEILSKESELLGDQKKKLLEYIGYDQLGA
jgi:uncharacterized membrane protein YkvA (DUF1232 family)